MVEREENFKSFLNVKICREQDHSNLEGLSMQLVI
jgi:hypothetical protein